MNFQDAYGLKGRRALVTGGSRGLGLATAGCLIAAGAEVILTATTEDGARKAAQGLGPNATGVVFDVTRHGEAAAFVDGLFEAHGPIDILVNNAGNSVKKPFEETTLADFDAVLDVHLRGAYAMTRAIIPHYLAAGAGDVVFIASMASFLGIPKVIGYSAAKSAYIGMVRALAVEFGGRGIRVNGVAPGWIDSDLYRRNQSGDPERTAKVLSRIPTGQVGEAEDIGWAVAYLVSRAAKYVNGHLLTVDGGAVNAF